MSRDYTEKDFRVDFRRLAHIWRQITYLGLEMPEDEYYMERLRRVTDKWKVHSISKQEAFDLLRPVIQEGIPLFEDRIDKYIKNICN